jgi:hypothetical protein
MIRFLVVNRKTFHILSIWLFPFPLSFLSFYQLSCVCVCVCVFVYTTFEKMTTSSKLLLRNSMGRIFLRFKFRSFSRVFLPKKKHFTPHNRNSFIFVLCVIVWSNHLMIFSHDYNHCMPQCLIRLCCGSGMYTHNYLNVYY